MAILSCEGKRIYFAHVPKTAGTSLYVAFIKAGWRVENVVTNPNLGTGKALLKEFGIKQLQIAGDLSELETLGRSPQHAPISTWEKWGPFDESFAIVRHPGDRFLSALKYQFQGLGAKRKRDIFKHKSIDTFRKRVLSDLSSDPASLRHKYDGHFAPQTDFVARDTKVFRFEGDFTGEISDRYGLQKDQFPALNISKSETITLTPDEQRFVESTYADDFNRFGY